MMYRRQFLAAALPGGTAAAMVPALGKARTAPLQTTARIVIIGTGASGTALFTGPVTEMKCAGTPLKHAFLIDDIARRAGRGP